MARQSEPRFKDQGATVEARPKSFILYRGWGPLFKELSDADAGILIKTIFDYHDGQPVNIEDQKLRAIFALFQAVFCENSAKYSAVCERNAANGRKGGRPRKAQEAVADDPGKAGGKLPARDPLIESRLSEPVRDKLREWLAYKAEKRQSYKPQGFKALLSRVEKAEEAHGAAAVVGLIEDAMSSGYQGIIWEKLERASPGNSRPGQQRGTVKQNQFTAGVENNSYDFDALERDLLAN